MLDEKTGIFHSEQIGSFFSFYRATDDEGVVSLIGEARIPKRQPELCESILQLYQAGTLNFSFEIEVSHASQCEGVTLIDAEEGNE